MFLKRPADLFVLLLLAVGLGLVTCSHEAAIDPDRYYDKANGFSIKYPEAWSVCEGHAEDDPVVEGLSPWEDDYDEFAEHMTVDVELIEAGTSLDSYSEETIEAQMAEIPGFEVTERGRATLDGEDAVWIVFDFESEGGMVTVLGYSLVKGERGYLISGVAQSSKFSSYRNRFEQIAESFRFE